MKAFLPGTWPPRKPAPPPSSLEPDYEPLYTAWKTDPSPANTGALLKSVNPILDEAIRTYAGPVAASPTLRGKAKLTAVGAFKSYDPARGKLRTHLLSQLQSLRRLAAREEQPIRVPEGLALDRVRVLQATNELRDRLDRDPSDAEIADHTGISLRRLARTRAVKPTYAEGQQTREGEEGEYTTTPATVATPDRRAQEMWLEYIWHDLQDEKDRYLLEKSTGMRGNPILSNQEVAKNLRLSPGAVSQRRVRLQKMLDQATMTRILG